MNAHLQMELIYLVGLAVVFVGLPLLAVYLVARVVMAALRRVSSTKRDNP